MIPDEVIMNEDWQPRLVYRPKGTHASASKITPGAERELLREDGTNKLLGPPESFPLDEEMLSRRAGALKPSPTWQAPADETTEALRAAVSEILFAVATEIIFPVATEILLPAMKRKVSEIAKGFRSKTRQAGAIAPTVTNVNQLISRDVGAAVDAPRTSMSGTEYRQRALAALAAEAYAAKQKKILSNARIEDDDLPAKLRNAIKLTLEGKASVLDGEEIVELVKFLRGAPVLDGDQAGAEPRPPSNFDTHSSAAIRASIFSA